MLLFFQLMTTGALRAEITWDYIWQTPSLHAFRLRLEAEGNMFFCLGELDRPPLSHETDTSYFKFKGELPGWGFRTQYLCYGPFIKKGLLREWDNYARYTCASTLFNEKTALKVTTTMHPASPRMVSLALLPGYLSLFCQHDRGQKIMPGFYTTLPLGRKTGIEAALARTIPLTEKIPALLHSAFRLRSGLDSFKGCVSLLFSRNPVPSAEMGGILFHIQGAGHKGPFSPGLLLEYCSPGYLNPAGKTGANHFKAQCELGYNPLPGFTLHSQYSLAFPPLPDNPPAFLPCREIFKIGARGEFSAGDKTGAVMDWTLRQNLISRINGIQDMTRIQEGSIQLLHPPLYATLAWKYSLASTGPGCQEWKSSLKLSRSSWGMTLGLKLTEKDLTRIEGKVGFNLSAPAYSLGFRGTLCPLDLTQAGLRRCRENPWEFLKLTITWQTKSAATDSTEDC